MDYETFCGGIVTEVKKKLGEGYKTERCKLAQINDGFINHLLIINEESDTSVIINIGHYFSAYCEGFIEFHVVVEAILNHYRQQEEAAAEDSVNNNCFDSVKNRIVYRLISSSLNTQYLSDVPYFEFLDFAIIFFIIDEKNMEVEELVNDQKLAEWKVKKKELMRLANENTPRLFGAQIDTLEDVLNDLEQRSGDVDETELQDFKPYYMLTNVSGWYGATCILYEGVLKCFAEQMESDLLLLPSSLHEFLILPYNPEKVNWYKERELVRYVNANHIPAGLHLTDEVYLYIRQTDTIEIAEEHERPSSDYIS